MPVRTNLVDFLRGELGLTGSHVGCEHGVCGACTIEVDGQAVRGCLMLAVQADGAEVTTVEGLADSGRGAALRAAFIRRNALQCGYCTPGMLSQRAGIRRARRDGRPTGDPRAHLGQLLPLHRLSVGRRRDLRRDRGEGRHEPAIDRARPAEFLHRPRGAAPRRAPPDRGTGPLRRRHDAAADGACGLRALAPRPRRRSSASMSRPRRPHPGVVAVYTAADLEGVVEPYVGVLTHLAGLRSAAADAAGGGPRRAGRASRWRWWWPGPAPWPRTRPSWSRSTTRSCRPPATWSARSSPTRR